MKGNSTRGKLGVSEIKAKAAAIVNIQVNLKVKLYPLKSFKICMRVARKSGDIVWWDIKYRYNTHDIIT